MRSGATDPITGFPLGTRQTLETDSTGYRVSLTQNVFDWTTFKTLEQAEKRVVRAETDFRAAQQDLIVRVAAAYFNVLAAEDSSRRPLRHATASPGSSSSRNGASRSA